LARITKDFPEFNWHEFKQKSENMLKSALLAITKENAALVTDASDDLRTQISLTISANREQHMKETYQTITIHQTEITDYRKTAGTCIITLQTAVGFLHYQKKNGILILGSDTALKQTRFNIELLYIQDADKVKGNALSLTCPSCGAPVHGVGQKICGYCGCAVTEISIRAWALNRYYEV
ncbi:MAG: zinc ribbon domain-containing protein, partial [Lachnospiraceae bacterium]